MKRPISEILKEIDTLTRSLTFEQYKRLQSLRAEIMLDYIPYSDNLKVDKYFNLYLDKPLTNSIFSVTGQESCLFNVRVDQEIIDKIKSLLDSYNLISSDLEKEIVSRYKLVEDYTFYDLFYLDETVVNVFFPVDIFKEIYLIIQSVNNIEYLDLIPFYYLFCIKDKLEIRNLLIPNLI